MVMNAATDPDTALDEGQAIRERLALAGLLESQPTERSVVSQRPTPADVQAAARRAARGTALSDHVSLDR